MDISSKSESYINPKIILAGVVASSIVIYFYNEWTHKQWSLVNQSITYALLLTILAITGWFLLDRWPLISKWFVILVLSTAIHLWIYFFQFPAAFTLTAITVVLTVPILGVFPAALVAGTESILVILMASPSQNEAGTGYAVIALILIWANYLAMYATLKSGQEMRSWFSEYFMRAQILLEEARNHRAELIQTMDDMAHLNQQLAILNKRVNDLRLIAEEAEKSKTRFVARVSHEFRTPLNMIIGLVDLIAEKPEIYDAILSPRMRDSLRIVHRNCRHLADMVNDVLDLSRIETERMVLNKERVDIPKLIDAAVDTVRPLLENKNIGIEIETPPDLPQVYCDRTRIEQVILNLISNSARYTEKGSIRITAIRHEPYVRMSVQDTGLGISKEDLNRIFEPFSQGTSEFVSKKGGSGLGLSISKQFIELHNGRMWVDSELGVGSTFTFELPITSPMDPIVRPGHQITESWVWRERRKGRQLPDMRYSPRLIVCDDADDLNNLLDRYSGEVDLVKTTDIQQVANALRQAPANAVILNKSTLEDATPLVKIIKPLTSGIPVIVCNVPRSLELARTQGLVGQLIKPVSRADLQSALTTAGKQVRRVLLVDDDSDVINLFYDMLKVCDPSLEIVTAGVAQKKWTQKMS